MNRIKVWGRPREPLEPELLAHDPRDLAAVGAPAGLAHDVADDDADRFHVTGAQALGDLGVGVECRLHGGVERVAAADGTEALGLDDGGRVAALGQAAMAERSSGLSFAIFSCTGAMTPPITSKSGVLPVSSR